MYSGVKTTTSSFSYLLYIHLQSHQLRWGFSRLFYIWPPSLLRSDWSFFFLTKGNSLPWAQQRTYLNCWTSLRCGHQICIQFGTLLILHVLCDSEVLWSQVISLGWVLRKIVFIYIIVSVGSSCFWAWPIQGTKGSSTSSFCKLKLNWWTISNSISMVTHPMVARIFAVTPKGLFYSHAFLLKCCYNTLFFCSSGWTTIRWQTTKSIFALALCHFEIDFSPRHWQEW